MRRLTARPQEISPVCYLRRDGLYFGYSHPILGFEAEPTFSSDIVGRGGARSSRGPLSSAKKSREGW